MGQRLSMRHRVLIVRNIAVRFSLNGVQRSVCFDRTVPLQNRNPESRTIHGRELRCLTRHPVLVKKPTEEDDNRNHFAASLIVAAV